MVYISNLVEKTAKVKSIEKRLELFGLRYALYRTEYIPWNYRRFLDHATKLNLLHKLDDGYAFIHPIIQHYFATLDSEQPQDMHVEDEQDMLNKRIESLGAMHPDTARSFNTYGMELCANGDYDAAQKHLEQAVDIRFTLLGAYHPSTATSLNNLGMVHQYSEEYALAQPLFKHAWDIRKKTLGPQHIETVESMHNLAMNFFYQKDIKHAQRLFEQALAIREQTLGHNHPATALSHAGMGLVLQDISQYDSVMAKNSLFPSTPSTSLGTSSGNGSIKKEQGHLEEALRHLDEAFQICEQALGSDNPETIMCLSHLALLLWEKGEDRSVEYFEMLKTRLTSYIEQTQPNERVVVDSLHTIIADMHARTSQSKLTRSTSLNRITSDLAKMPHLITGLPKPQQLTIKRITDRWREVVSREAGRVGKLEQKQTIVSPYIFTAPVAGVALVGRDDIFQEITRSWSHTRQRDSLLIHGHRRMGKTSVAKALAERCNLGSDTRLIYISVDGIDRSNEGYLYFEIVFLLAMEYNDALEEPEEEPFLANFHTAFNHFLARLNKFIGNTRFIVVLDEFEALLEDMGIAQTKQIISYLRSRTQTYPWLTLALVGPRDFEDLKMLYEESVFGWKDIKIGFLEKDQVANVLNNPANAPDFPLEYSRDAQEMIATLTNGQPYLVQFIGDQLVKHYNNIVFTKRQNRSNMFEIADVEAVINAPHFNTSAAAYFRGIWYQAILDQPEKEKILVALAHYDATGTDEVTLANSIADLDDETFHEALNWLLRHDILGRAQANGTGTIYFSVPLMYRWVHDTKLHTIEAIA